MSDPKAARKGSPSDAPAAVSIPTSKLMADDPRRSVGRRGALGSLTTVLALATFSNALLFVPTSEFAARVPLAAALWASAASWGIVRLAQRGAMLKTLAPKPGDVSKALAVALFLYTLFGMLSGGFLGAPSAAWLEPLYGLWAEPDSIEGGNPRTVLLALVLGALHEFVWRGRVQWSLSRHFPPVRALVITTFAEVVASVPTVWMLGGMQADGLHAGMNLGPNPVVVTLSLLTGVALGSLFIVTGRVFPGVLARAFLYWLLVSFPPQALPAQLRALTTLAS